jgi:hypothetical protein
MFNKLKWFVIFAACVFQIEIMAGIDPILDFRAPYSLTELLHDGLISVQTNIERMLPDDDKKLILVEAQETLRQLLNSYETMIDRSNIDMVHRDDREFLQSLIDRIDSMISSLERSVDVSDTNLSLFEDNVALLHQLKNMVHN